MWVSLPDISCLFHAPPPANTLCVSFAPRSVRVRILPDVLVIASEAPFDWLPRCSKLADSHVSVAIVPVTPPDRWSKWCPIVMWLPGTTNPDSLQWMKSILICRPRRYGSRNVSHAFLFPDCWLRCSIVRTDFYLNPILLDQSGNSQNPG